jgi:hypothetical protein
MRDVTGGWNKKTFEEFRDNFKIVTSVADPGCLSRISDPDFYPSRIQQQHQKRRKEIFICPATFYSRKYRKIVYNFILEHVKKFI